MRLFIFIFLTCKVLLFADGYSIQLMSYRYDSSLTPYFMSIVKRTNLEYRIVEEDGYKKILLGSFGTRHKADVIYKSLHCIPEDSFVRKLHVKNNMLATVNNKNRKKNKSTKRVECTEKEQCRAIKQYDLRRKCEIKEALEYLRNSGYYHFADN